MMEKMENKRFCQSCAMPIEGDENKGTNKDGSKSEDFCVYCWKDGAYTAPDVTMEQMIEICVPHMQMDADEARAQMREFFPKLKRWS